MAGTSRNLTRFMVAVVFVAVMILAYQVTLGRYQTDIKAENTLPSKTGAPSAPDSLGTKHKNKQQKPRDTTHSKTKQQKPSKRTETIHSKNKGQKPFNQRATVASASSSSNQLCDLSGYSNPFPPVFTTNDVFLVDWMAKNGGYNATLGAGVRQETLDPTEEHLFRLPIADNPLCLPEELLSQVHVIDPRDRYIVGDKIRFRVDLYTGHGTRRRSGGDDVRMWLQSAVGNWSMVAAVTDLGNGSYLGDAVLKWSGVTVVKVSLTYPREYLRALVEMIHTIHSLRFVPNAYRRGNKTEKTICFPFAPVPGFDKWCNLTSANGDRSWYCGHPVSEGLQCSDWSDIFAMPFLDIRRSPIHRAVKPYVNKLTHCCDNETLALRLIPNDIEIKTRPNPAASSPTLPPCSSLPAAQSWLSSAHQGLIDSQGAWRPSHCALPDLTRQFVSRCMRNTTLMLLGDSNQRNWFNKVLSLLPGCTSGYQGKGGWHAPRLCQNKELNYTLMTAAHSMPFSTGLHADLVTIPLPQALDLIPSFASSNSKTVVVLHYYRHFIAFSVQVYRQRVREARRTLEAWVLLHPEVMIFIRGPHTVYRSFVKPILQTGDAGVQAYAQVWREEFAGLRDRVRFLDMWDLTVAAQSLDAHPANPTGMELFKVLMGYMCQGDTH